MDPPFVIVPFTDWHQPAAVAIEREAFEHPWSDAAFRAVRAQKKAVGFVIHENGAKPDAVLGYLVAEVEGNKIHILNLAVRRDRRRRELGTLLVGRLKAVLSPDRFRRLYCYVRETNLAAQLFFRAVGFRATYIERGFYDHVYDRFYDVGGGQRAEDSEREDAYRFAYHVHCAPPAHSHCK